MGTGELAEGFFEPTNLKGCQEPGSFQSVLDLQRLSRIYHQVALVTYHPAGRLNMSQIRSHILSEWAPPKLHRRQAEINGLPSQIGGFLRT
jgi:hypothetical protein